jgi:dTDP-4-dehydrorhamnose 3,5-epimerase
MLQEAATAMQIADAEIADIKLIKPVRHGDHRGFFSEVFRESVLRQQGIDLQFVQENHSLSASKGVVRGLHFQVPPFAQAKLLRVTSGSIFDVAVDIRWGSPTFGRHVAAVLSVSEWNQLLIPEGFAHGFCTLEPDTEVIYKVSNYYSAEHDRGLLWNDPALGIDWPVSIEETVLSERDRQHPLLADLPRFFRYEPSMLRVANFDR